MTDTACKLEAIAGDRADPVHGSQRTVRDLTLDVVKGVLVVIMVVYHAMNIFSSAGPEEYAYVRFVSGSFILMSGYIVARFHEAQFQVDWMGTSRRLVARGVKLLMMFTLLNVLINLTGVGNPNKAQPAFQDYASHLFEIYVSGVPGRASFQILLPIAYLLIAAPIFLALADLRRWLLLASCLVTLAPLLVGISSVNFDFVSMGAIGLAGGMLVNGIDRPLAMRGVWSIAASLLGAMMLMKYLYVTLATYALGTVLILKLLYDLSQALRLENRFARGLVLLGQYSLLCYIGQIVFMRLLHSLLARPQWELGYETVLVVVATIVFLLAFCMGLGMLRRRQGFVAKLYRLIFA